MKITITNKQLANSIPGMNALGALKLPTKVNYKIAKNLRILEGAYEPYQKVYGQLVDQHAKRDENRVKIEPAPGQVTIENLDKFNAEVNVLLAETVEVDIWPIKLSELGEESLTGAQLMSIDWLIDDDSAETEQKVIN